MKKFFLLILIFPFIIWAQVDSLKSQEAKIISCDKNMFPKDTVYVIDGIYIDDQSSYRNINPNEIESITIIKETSEILSHLNKPLVIIKTKKYQEELDAKETKYDLAVLDLGYESFLKMQPSAGTYSLGYLQNKNAQYVSIWNQRVLTGNPDIYEMEIDYDPKIYYGLELEHKLYMFFQFMEQKYSISML